jgi:hypothetical protein
MKTLVWACIFALVFGCSSVFAQQTKSFMCASVVPSINPKMEEERGPYVVRIFYVRAASVRTS